MTQLNNIVAFFFIVHVNVSKYSGTLWYINTKIGTDICKHV